MSQLQEPVMIVATAGVVPERELGVSVGRLRAMGREVIVGPGVFEQNFLFPSDDLTRARRFWNAAQSLDARVLWCARGGYGSARILPELERLTLAEGTPPPKLLCGYSDITALHEFVRSRWGWSSLHCEMPGGAAFAELPEEVLATTLGFIDRGPSVAGAASQVPRPQWAGVTLLPMGVEVHNDLVGTLVGGNLTVLASLVGTPFAVDNSGGRLLFIEDVSEAPYRLDRCLHQLRQGGVFRGVRAMILGTFHDCGDTPPTAGADRVPIRPKLETAEWMRGVFAEFSLATRIPVVATLPVGHSPGDKHPLPLGARYRLTGGGRLELIDWGWKSDLG